MTGQKQKNDRVDITSFDIEEIPEKDRSKTVLSFFRMKLLAVILVLLTSSVLVFYDKIGEITFSTIVIGGIALYFTGKKGEKDE